MRLDRRHAGYGRVARSGVCVIKMGKSGRNGQAPFWKVQYFFCVRVKSKDEFNDIVNRVKFFIFYLWAPVAGIPTVTGMG